MRATVHGAWKSPLTLVAAATGAAVGMGNLWKFAYVTGQHGGAAFVLVYVLCMLLIGLPLLVAEFAVGARGRGDPHHAATGLVLEAGVSPRWHWLGGLAIVSAVLVLSYFSVVAGWSISYLQIIAGDELEAASGHDVGQRFARLLADDREMLISQSLFLGGTVLIVASGVLRGLGLIARLLLPMLLALLGLLVYQAAQLGDMPAALHYLFDFREVDLSLEAVLAALGHVFFSLSLGTGVMLTLGAYAPDRRSLIAMGLGVVVLDLLIGLLAGLAIYPLVFSQHIEPTAGPGLLFITLPYIFANLESGLWLGSLFFMTAILAAFGSSIALLEVPVAWLVQRWRWPRPLAALGAGLLVWALGLISVYSFNVLADVRPLGLSLFAWLDRLLTLVLLPVVGLGVALLVGWRARLSGLRDEFVSDRPAVFGIWYWLLRYIAPPAVVALLVAGWLGW